MNKRSILLICLCMIICTYGVNAEELGGFFVDIGPGQSSQYPEQWYDQPQISDETTVEEPVNCQPAEELYESYIESIPQNQNPLPPAVYFDFPTSDLPVNPQQSVFVYPETVASTEILTPDPHPRASPSCIPSVLITETPVPAQTPVPTQTVTPVPSLSAVPATEAKRTDERQEERLEVCYFSTAIQQTDLENIRIKMKSEYPVYVWSVRINKQEQKWSWKENQTIVIEDVKKSRNYKLELLSFCDRKDKIQVFLDDKIK